MGGQIGVRRREGRRDSRGKGGEGMEKKEKRTEERGCIMDCKI